MSGLKGTLKHEQSTPKAAVALAAAIVLIGAAAYVGRLGSAKE